MPTSIIAALVGYGAATAAGMAVGTFAFAAVSALAGGAVSMLIGAAFSSKPDQQQAADFQQSIDGRSTTIRQAIAPRQVIYGEVLVGGVITYVETTGNNGNIFLIITFSGHPVEEIGDVYFGDVPVTEAQIDQVTRSINAGPWAGYGKIYKALGDEVGQPFPVFVGQSAGLWTDAHRQEGCAKICVQLSWKQSIFPTGIPNIRAMIKGKKVLDPRVSPAVTAYSTNAALCVADYMSSSLGMGADYTTEIDEALLVAAANVCDEQVLLKRGSPQQYESRYTMNGTYVLSETPRDLLPQLLGAMQGMVVYLDGRWRLRAGAYITPTVTLDEDDARGALSVTTRRPRRDNFNGVKGVFVDPTAWQPTDFPPVTNAAYIAEDNGEQVWKDINLRFTTSPSMAQRIAKIELERARKQTAVAMPCHLSAYVNQPPETVMLNNTRFGWSAKVFEIAELAFTPDTDANGEPVLGVDLTLRETASTVYDWSAAEEQIMGVAPDLVLPADIGPITGLALSSGTADLYLAGDGTVHSRIHVTWTAVVDAFVTDSGHIEIQYALAAGSPPAWLNAPNTAGDATSAYIDPVNDAVQYSVRVRAVNSLAVASDWNEAPPHLVIGKTALPADVTGFSAQQNGLNVNFQWAQAADADLAGYEIRYAPVASAAWGSATVITSVTRGTAITNGFVPPGTWRLMLKARDTSGNYSLTAAVFDIVVGNENNLVVSSEQAPQWLGSKLNLVQHWTGVLFPDSAKAANQHTNAELFEQFVPYPCAICEYTAAELDAGIDDTVRAWAENAWRLARDETASGNPQLQIDHRLAAGSYDGFESWTIGDVTARYVQEKLAIDTATGVPVLTSFRPTIDAIEYTQHAEAVVASAGGTAITFPTAFHATPNIQVTAQVSGSPLGSGFGVYESPSATGFIAHWLDSSGASVGGTVNWNAQGH